MRSPHDTRKRSAKTLSGNSSNQQQQTSSTASGNIFNALDEMDLSDNNSEASLALSKSSKRSRLTSPKKQKPKQKSDQNALKTPPLTIVNETYSRVKTKIDKALNFQHGLYQIKFNPNGIQVFPTSTEVFQKIKKCLIESNSYFFTHDLREEQMSKFVLHGYITTSENDLMKLLKEVNVTPVKVKTLTIKNKKFIDHAVYLVYFMKSQKIKISQLREVQSLNHVRIKWDYYSNRLKGPIQCSNCQTFGHGGKNCHLIPRCIRCSDSHKSINCPKLIDSNTMKTRTRIPDEELKCSNCGKNHAANYSKCEKRIEFNERRKQYRSKTQQKFSNHFKPAPELNDFNYPQLNSSSAPHNPGISKNFSSQDNNLFTAPQLMEIFTELMIKMQSASTKLQQIQALGEIVIKYAYR